jgi:DNA-binding HxlR family transcriptional regulator
MKSPDLALTRDALATSTLSHGLQVLGDRSTVQLLLSAFVGLRRFEDLQSHGGIARPTLAGRLKALVQLGVLQPQPYQQKPTRYAYHLTPKGLGLYDTMLMLWAWEKRWKDSPAAPPAMPCHAGCGPAFEPLLCCKACGQPVTMKDLHFALVPQKDLQAPSTPHLRSPRMHSDAAATVNMGVRVDRWSLLIVTAVVLGCHYFDQLFAVLGIGSSVLSRRLRNMVAQGLLRCETDRDDARRRIYRLTPCSRDLFGYIVCFSTWAGEAHLHAASSIVPVHKGCQLSFYPKVVCHCCHASPTPLAVNFQLYGDAKV